MLRLDVRELVDSLTGCKDVIIRERIMKRLGVIRKIVAETESYTINLEYMDFGGAYVLLELDISETEGQNYSLTSSDEFYELTGIKPYIPQAKAEKEVNYLRAL